VKTRLFHLTTYYKIKGEDDVKGSTEKVTWNDIRLNVHAKNKNLAAIIDKIDPGETFHLYKVRYPFGATIVDKGTLQIPLINGDIVPINDSRVDHKLQMDLAYAENGLPAGILTKNSYELFINSTHLPLPVLVANEGSTFALWKQLDTTPSFHPIKIFNVVAGARSLFMLPNIGDFMNHKNLKRDFNVSSQPPKTLKDQWNIFKGIAEHEQCDWYVELILIPGKWIAKAKKEQAWHELYLHLLEYAWKSSGYERNQIFYEYALSIAQANNNLKPNPYLLDTVRHLLSITLGATPGFKPATDESMGPITLLQNAYIESYGMKKYTPTFIHPSHFNLHDSASDPVYYSFQNPTTISFSPRSRKLSNTLFDLRELRHILHEFLDEVRMNSIALEDTIVGIIPDRINFRYFHSKLDKHSEIESSKILNVVDSNFTAYCEKNISSHFAGNGAFIRGCVQISHNLT
jgi:hypothetical protein